MPEEIKIVMIPNALWTHIPELHWDLYQDTGHVCSITIFDNGMVRFNDKAQWHWRTNGS